MNLKFSEATIADAPEIAALRGSATEDLTRRFGRGHWSSMPTERGVVNSFRFAKVIVGRSRGRIVATARLATKKPWAIDVAYFTPCEKALYLTDMAVAPNLQGRGFGRELIEEARRVAKAWPANAIRLDAYDAVAGAGQFYAKCGFAERGRVVYRTVPLIYYERMLS